MAAVALSAAMSTDGEKSVHPFFTRVNGANSHIQDGGEKSANEQPFIPNHIEVLEGATEKSARADSKRKNTRREGLVNSSKTQKTLSDVVVPRVKSTGEYSVVDAPVLSYEQGEPHRKRRRSNELDTGEGQADATQHHRTVFEDGGVSTASWMTDRVAKTASVSDEATSVCPSVQTRTDPATPAKKMLRLKPNGRFSSPVSAHVKDEPDMCENGPQKRRTRGGKPKLSLLAKITYGSRTADRDLICNTIDRILNGEERVTLTLMPKSTKRTPEKPKATHPFFLGKPKPDPPTLAKASPRKASAVTPGKLRRQTFASHEQNNEQSTNDSWGSGLLRDRLMVRHPGAREPPFPHKGQVHIRSLSDGSPKPTRCNEDFGILYGHRKYKGARLPFPERESVIFQGLPIETTDNDSVVRPDGFHDPSPLLHVPQRRLLCGADILQRASSQLRTHIGTRDNDARGKSLSQSGVEPALQRLVDDIPTTLTAFDNVGGEAYAWTQKYAPKTVSDVLQPTKVMIILKDWLSSLKVQTVSSTTSKDSKAVPKASAKPKKKRKKKDDDLYDFLVDSDEDINDMNEVLDAEDGSSTEVGKPLKSIVQASHGGTKLSNAVLISGPSGCGKTAAAYAVAKELDFKVFEINSSERRNGKDVIERVGDMAENHLVKHHGTDSAELSSNEEPSRIDEAFHRDLESGRQGKMNAFFKPQATSKLPVLNKSQPSQILKTVHEAVKKPPKEQQQSLILLEEVDVLFRDDKDFWTVVLKLIVDSKRPFIMTCNDEDMVPLQAIKLHAILRLLQPPEDLTVDYILLVAAAEGHLLDRKDILSLYRSKGFDFRATLTQLDFWCQMGIGDPRGGLAWIYQRWPPGSDLDEQGRKLRVTSDGTYIETAGLTLDSDKLSAESMLRWTWSEFGVDPAVALGWHEFDRKLGRSPEGLTTDPPYRFTALEDFARLTDDLSAADICCAINFPGEPSLDTTTPGITDKARGQYVEGLYLLQADECPDHAHLNEELLVSMNVLAFQANGFLDRMDASSADRFLPYITAEKEKIIGKRDIGRRSFACFDAIAVAEDSALPIGTGMIQSAFDGPLESIVLDLAPYARLIVSYDRALEEQRERIDQVTSDGRRAKRPRTTRAARSALGGGQRATTRKERWFAKNLDYDAVLATGGDEWRRSVIEVLEEGSKDGTEAPSPSAASTADTE